MKKIIALLLALVMCFTLCACGDSGTTYNLGETVSTDLLDFTLQSAELTYYASARSDNYLTPMSESDGGIFHASLGHVLIIMTFTVNNKDRSYINVDGMVDSWGLNFKMNYDGNEYSVNGYDLNNRDGDISCLLLECLISDDGTDFYELDTNGYLQYPGETTYRVAGIVAVDPENLDDAFELTVNVMNSSGESEYFTYTINQ